MLKNKITQLPNGRTRVVITLEFGSDVHADMIQFLSDREQVKNLLDSIGPTWDEIKKQAPDVPKLFPVLARDVRPYTAYWYRHEWSDTPDTWSFCYYVGCGVGPNGDIWVMQDGCAEDWHQPDDVVCYGGG